MFAIHQALEMKGKHALLYLFFMANLWSHFVYSFLVGGKTLRIAEVKGFV